MRKGALDECLDALIGDCFRLLLIGFHFPMHYPYSIDSVLLELLLYKGRFHFLIFDDLGLPS